MAGQPFLRTLGWISFAAFLLCALVAAGTGVAWIWLASQEQMVSDDLMAVFLTASLLMVIFALFVSAARAMIVLADGRDPE